MAVLLVLVMFAFNYWRLRQLTEPIIEDLNAMTARSSAPVSAPPAAAPRLMELLASESPSEVRIEQDGRRTRITLLAPNLFASGSAVLNEGHTATLTRVARAINQVPGRVLVEGHTDDQAVRGGRYANNLALSRARADGVADTLRRALDDPNRVESIGHGSDSPRYVPASTTENRARNRRVEIIHDPGA
jgi:type VI secretion system protein ImpK